MAQMYTLHDTPFFAVRARIHFPKSHAAPESVAIIAALETFRQRIKKSGIASAQNNVIGNKGALQLRNGIFHLAHPVLLA